MIDFTRACDNLALMATSATDDRAVKDAVRRVEGSPEQLAEMRALMLAKIAPNVEGEVDSATNEYLLYCCVLLAQIYHQPLRICPFCKGFHFKGEGHGPDAT